MEHSCTRLVIFSTLITLGVILVLLGFSWLTCLEITLTLLATFFSSRRRADGSTLALFVLFAAGAVVSLLSEMGEGEAPSKRLEPLWFCTGVTAGGLWVIVMEARSWWKQRALKCQRSPACTAP